MTDKEVDTRALEREIARLERELARVQRSDMHDKKEVTVIKIDGLVSEGSFGKGRALIGWATCRWY